MQKLMLTNSEEYIFGAVYAGMLHKKVSMKKLVTVANKYYNGYELLMCLEKGNSIDAEVGLRERFKIIFVEEGGGILKIEDRRHLFLPLQFFASMKMTIINYLSQ